MGSFKIDLKTVYDAPGILFIHGILLAPSAFFIGKGALSINCSLALEWDIFYYFTLYTLFEHCLEIFNTCWLHLDFTNVFSTKTGLEI